MEKHKSLWTTKEEDELCHRIRLGQTIEEIAHQHQRSRNAIELRFALIISRKLDKKEKIQNICKEYMMNEKKINYYLNLLHETKTQQEPNEMKAIENMLEKINSKLEVVEEKVTKLYRKFQKKV